MEHGRIVEQGSHKELLSRDGPYFRLYNSQFVSPVVDGYRADHMGVSPDGTRLLVSDSTAGKVHELDLRTGTKLREFDSGDTPHESNYTRDGSRIFHASIGTVYTPTDDPSLDASKGQRFFQVVIRGLR